MRARVISTPFDKLPILGRGAESEVRRTPHGWAIQKPTIVKKEMISMRVEEFPRGFVLGGYLYMEALEELSDSDADLVTDGWVSYGRSIGHQRPSVSSIAAGDWLQPSYLGSIAGRLEDLARRIFAIEPEACDRLILDLHGGNLMKRGGSLVVIDPFYDNQWGS